MCQYVAVCGSLLHCVVVWFSLLQCVAVSAVLHKLQPSVMQHCNTLYRVRQHVLTLKVAYQLKLVEKLNVQCAVNVWTLRFFIYFVQADCLHIGQGNSMCLLHTVGVLQCGAMCCSVCLCVAVFVCVLLCVLCILWVFRLNQNLPNQPCPACECVMFHVWMRHGQHINTSCPTCEYVHVIFHWDLPKQSYPVNAQVTYGVALVSRIDKIIGLFCKRDL